MSTTGDTLSSILGWVSIACWIVVYSPQLYENYALQSGEGLSVAFVAVWLLGDLCNLVGAAIAGLLPTVIILAVYYTLCDTILLLQIYYYRWIKSSGSSSPAERSPLIQSRPDEIATQRELEVPGRILVLRYFAASLFVCAAGVLAWWITNTPASEEELPQHPRKALSWEVQVIGWSSAVLYLGARLPQIFKNFKTRCAGLSPALFLFAIMGNATYALSICAKSMDRRYLIMNASWLAGSTLTILLDVIVLIQFVYYRTVDWTSASAHSLSL